MTIVEKLKAIKWVANAESLSSGYVVTTKPNLLKTELTHRIVIHKDGEWLMEPLEANILLPLPSYKFRLHNFETQGAAFYLKLAEKPEMKLPMVRFFPAYRNRRGDDQENWNEWIYPCLGMYEGDYLGAKDWIERASIAAEFLQLAIPDMYDRTADRSRYAYGMGIAPPELTRPATAVEEAAQENRKKTYEHARAIERAAMERVLQQMENT